MRKEEGGRGLLIVKVTNNAIYHLKTTREDLGDSYSLCDGLHKLMTNYAPSKVSILYAISNKMYFLATSTLNHKKLLRK